MPPPSASDLIARLPGEAVARFREDLGRLAGPEMAHWGLAVSGGPDSMAMLGLAAAAFPGQVSAATFDHRLRAGSADEARMVAEACRAIGVTHVTLMPEAPIVGSSIQMRAREARYAALAGWAAGEDIPAVLTAHHVDDQAETLLMRLNRASGVAGLAGVRAARNEGAVRVLRPLLGWRRAELRAIAEVSGMPFVDDPSNADPRHDRARIRAAIAGMPELDVERLAQSAAFLADAEDALVSVTDTLWRDRWKGPDQALAVAGEPRELRRRLVRRAILAARQAHGIAQPAFTDSTNVEPLLDALEEGKGAVQGGIKVVPARSGWVFRPAPPRRSH